MAVSSVSIDPDLPVFTSTPQPYPGFYFTGDGAARDEDGYIWIKGRVDGVFPFAFGWLHTHFSLSRCDQRIWTPTVYR